MKRVLLLVVALLMSLGTSATTEAAPLDICANCPTKAQRNGTDSVSVNTDIPTPATAVAKWADGRFGTVADRASRGNSRSTCPGCTYTRVPLIGATAPGGQSGAPFIGCTGTQFTQTQLVYRTTPGQAGRALVGISCPGTPSGAGAADTEPVITLDMIEGEVRRLTQQVAPPSPELGFAPTGTGIVNLPLIVWATPQRAVERDFAPYGIPVSATLTPSWEWTFEPGATTRTSTPGQPYRDNGVPVARDPAYVTHPYATPGAKQVSVTVRWAATWSLDGGAPRALGDLTRADTAAVTIREAPSRLVAR